MVIYSRSVDNVHCRFYLEDILKKGEPDRYSQIIEKLLKLDKSIISKYASNDQSLPFNWKEENCLIEKHGKYAFSYIKYKSNSGETVVVIEEVAEKKDNGYDILTENISIKNSPNLLYEKISNIITEAIFKTLNI